MLTMAVNARSGSLVRVVVDERDVSPPLVTVCGVTLRNALFRNDPVSVCPATGVYRPTSTPHSPSTGRTHSRMTAPAEWARVMPLTPRLTVAVCGDEPPDTAVTVTRSPSHTQSTG